MNRIKKNFDTIEKEWDYLQLKRDDAHSITVKDYPFNIGDNEIMIGIDDTNLNMLIRMDDVGEKGPISLLEGLGYKINKLSINNKKGIFLDIFADSNRRVQFSLFLAYFISYLELDPDLIEALSKTKKSLKKYWSGKNDILPLNKQIGLFGELSILEILMKNLDHRKVVESWEGPNDGLHDFNGHSMDLEVKSTLKDPPIVRVGNIDQLIPTISKSLNLIVNLFERGKGLTLSENIDSILDRYFNDDPELMILFEEKLLHVGYSHEYCDHYTERFTLRDQLLVEITDQSPVINSNILEMIPSTVRNVSYNLNVVGLNPEKMQESHWVNISSDFK